MVSGDFFFLKELQPRFEERKMFYDMKYRVNKRPGGQNANLNRIQH